MLVAIARGVSVAESETIDLQAGALFGRCWRRYSAVVDLIHRGDDSEATSAYVHAVKSYRPPTAVVLVPKDGRPSRRRVLEALVEHALDAERVALSNAIRQAHSPEIAAALRVGHRILLSSKGAEAYRFVLTALFVRTPCTTGPACIVHGASSSEQCDA